MRLRAELNEASKQRISINDMVIRAVAVAHKQIPAANVVWTDASMRHFVDVDVGVAIASERGLVTPVLRSIQDTTPSGIARRVQQFVQQANAGNLAQRDLEGGSITVTNLGMYGVEEFAAIINPPQSAILAVGAGAEQPVVINGDIQVANVVNLVMSVDHRAIDGALAAGWQFWSPPSSIRSNSFCNCRCGEPVQCRRVAREIGSTAADPSRLELRSPVREDIRPAVTQSR